MCGFVEPPLAPVLPVRKLLPDGGSSPRAPHNVPTSVRIVWVVGHVPVVPVAEMTSTSSVDFVPLLPRFVSPGL